VQGIVAEYERAKIMERSRRGKKHAAQSGSLNVMSGAPFGYRYVSVGEGGGQARFEPLAEQGKVVQQIFSWIGRDRCSLSEVCRRLHDAGIPTATGKRIWSREAVWHVLQNPAYQGQAAYGKTHMMPRGKKARPRAAGRQMHAWVSNDAMLRKSEIRFRCPCQTWFEWKNPYFRFDLYCPSCGTVIRITRMREPFGYCVLPEGPCDVFGADSPRIDHLSEPSRNKLYEIWEQFKTFANTLPKSDVLPVLLVGDIEHFTMMLPQRNPQELTTFISDEAVQNDEGIPIMCNCSFTSLWIPKKGSRIDRMTCWACGSSIRLLGLEGDGGYILGRVDGEKRLFDVQASKALPSWRLPDTERNEIIRKFEEAERNSSTSEDDDG
jgi:hypothetical protein